MANRGLLQAAGSWSTDACCAVHGNDCNRDARCSDGRACPWCDDRASSSDWLFGLWPGPPQRFEPTGTATVYQLVVPDWWPVWDGGLRIGGAPIDTSGAPGGSGGGCYQGGNYRGTDGEICGGTSNWGATDLEVWYPRV